MLRKNIFFITAVFFAVLSCRKEQTIMPPEEPFYVNPYPRPWKTEFISYKNVFVPDCGDNHSCGYKLFYKDTLIRTVCDTYQKARHIDTAFVVNDSTMFMFDRIETTGLVVYTRNGGYTWTEKQVGTKFSPKFYVVNPNLVYCFTTGIPANYYLMSGVGKSDLLGVHLTMIKGRYFVVDRGAGITDRDSTMINLNDSLTVVIRFK
jgi:hypothetical protein